MALQPDAGKNLPTTGAPGIVNKPGVARGELLKRIGYAQGLWREAQAKESVCRAHVTTVDMGGMNYKTFKRTHKREFKERSFGIDLVTDRGQDYTRRALFTKVYDDALRADMTDLFDNDGDIFADAAVETKSAMARLLDKTILNTITDRTQEVRRTNAPDGISGTNSLGAAADLAGVIREVTYADIDEDSATLGDVTVTGGKKKALTNATKIRKTEADTFTRLIVGLKKKDVRSEICMTLTPQLREILETDEKFQNAENIYNGRAEGAGKGDFTYRGVMLKDISPSVMPDLKRSASMNADVATSGAKAGKRLVTVRPLQTIHIDLNEREDASTHDSQGRRGLNAKFTYEATTAKAAKTRLADSETNGGAAAAAAPALDWKKQYNIAEVDVDKDELVYFWAKEAIYFASRDELMRSFRSTLPEFRHAEQQYDIVSFGAMCIDDNFAGALVISDGTKKLETIS